MTSPITGHMVVMQYHDRSGIIGAFGPYPTHVHAEEAIEWLKQMPMRQEAYEIVPVFGAPGPDEATR